MDDKMIRILIALFFFVAGWQVGSFHAETVAKVNLDFAIQASADTLDELNICQKTVHAHPEIQDPNCRGSVCY